MSLPVGLTRPSFRPVCDSQRPLSEQGLVPRMARRPVVIEELPPDNPVNSPLSTDQAAFPSASISTAANGQSDPPPTGPKDPGMPCRPSEKPPRPVFKSRKAAFQHYLGWKGLMKAAVGSVLLGSLVGAVLAIGTPVMAVTIPLSIALVLGVSLVVRLFRAVFSPLVGA